MKIIIFGTGDCAQLAHFYLMNDTNHEVVGFCVNKKYQEISEFNGLPVLCLENLKYKPTEVKFFAPLYDNYLRLSKFLEIKKLGFDFISYVSSKSTCWGTVGQNSFIMEDNTIQPYVKIGDNVILWSGNHIGHHSIICDNVFISSHVVVAGHCKVNPFCWLGINSTIKDHVELAEGSKIGMSACVINNTQINKTYIGVPAKVKA